MNFSEQLRDYRKKQNMTKEQMAEVLDVSCKTFSQWENGVNLPDRETLANISNILGFSLEEPVPERGDKDITTKPSKKRKQARTISIRVNLFIFIIGFLFLVNGVGLIGIKANTVEYIDAAGWLYESFFLIPLGMLSLFFGVAVILASGVKSLIERLKSNCNQKNIG